MTNIEVRDAIKRTRVYGYEIAAALGISETHFSRKMRKEFTPEEKNRVLAVIAKLAKGETK